MSAAFALLLFFILLHQISKLSLSLDSVEARQKVRDRLEEGITEGRAETMVLFPMRYFTEEAWERYQDLPPDDPRLRLYAFYYRRYHRILRALATEDADAPKHWIDEVVAQDEFSWIHEKVRPSFPHLANRLDEYLFNATAAESPPPPPGYFLPDAPPDPALGDER